MFAPCRWISALLLAGLAGSAIGLAALRRPAPTAAFPSNREVILATTTSTQDSGLLDVLIPMFEHRTGYEVKPIAVGSGQALALGARGEVDVLLAHAPDAELTWMAEGNGTARLRVMHNDYVLLGPSEDPAHVRSERDASAALSRVARSRVPFISRGDNSGTHQAELALWRAAGTDPQAQPWYQQTGQGMGATLNVASEKRAYTLVDRGTYLARRATVQLEILIEGSADLRNVYHVLPVNPTKFPRVNGPGGQAFALFLLSDDAQAAIASFGVDRVGQPFFFVGADQESTRDAGRLDH
jgi:tungstate transport system substrate-binding protein